jgi:hypothetical protein
LCFLEDDYFYFNKCGAKEQILNDTAIILREVFLFFGGVLGMKTRFFRNSGKLLLVPYTKDFRRITRF